MKIRNNNPLDLEGNDGETISVKVTAFGTNLLGNYNLDGVSAKLNAAGSFSFTLNKAANNPSLLTLFLIFTNSSGGVYQVDLSGSAGGHAQHTSNQVTGGFGSSSFTFTIDIV